MANNLYYETFQSNDLGNENSLLGGNFIIPVKIRDDYNNKYNLLFKIYFMIINTEGKCEYINCVGSAYMLKKYKIFFFLFYYDDILNSSIRKLIKIILYLFYRKLNRLFSIEGKI